MRCPASGNGKAVSTAALRWTDFTGVPVIPLIGTLFLENSPASCPKPIPAETTRALRCSIAGAPGGPRPHGGRRRISPGNLPPLVVSQPVHRQPSKPPRRPSPMAPGDRGATLVSGSRPGTGGSARTPIICLAGVRLPEIWLPLQGCPRDSAGGESAGQMRDLPLQLGRHARLGVLPDKHRAPETARFEPPRSSGLQSKHRLRRSALSGAWGLYSMEHLQQRDVQKVYRNRIGPAD